MVVCLGSVDQRSFSLMGLRRGGALVIRVGIQCMVVQILICPWLFLSMQLRERYLLARRLGRSVEFTACAGRALAYAWSVVPSVNPSVVWCSFCVGRDFALLGQTNYYYFACEKHFKKPILELFFIFISFHGALKELWTNRKTS